MKFEVGRASKSWREPVEIVEINSLEELLNFIEKVNDDIIIRKDGSILIYDDYIE